MTRSQPNLKGILGAALVLWVVLSPKGAAEDSPSYQGKPLSHWVAVLKNPAASYSDKEEANGVLDRLGAADVAGVPDLIDALGPREDRSAIMALGRIGMPAVPALLKAVRQPLLRSSASLALRRVGPRVIPDLLVLFQDKDPFIREQAIGALGGYAPEHEEAIPPLLEAMKDQAFHVRARAAKEIEQGLRDLAFEKGFVPDGPIAFGRAETKTLVHSLMGLLNDEYGDVRIEGVSALGQFGPEAKEALTALLNQVKEKDFKMRGMDVTLASYRGRIYSALGEIDPTNKEVLAILEKGLCDEVSGFKAGGVPWAFSKSGPLAVPILVDALKEAKDDLKGSIITVLGNLGADAKPAVPALIAVLGDESVQLSALEALGKVGPGARDAIPTLMALLENNSADVRRAAAETLGKIGPVAKEAVPALTKMLAEPTAREAGRIALSQIDPEAARKATATLRLEVPELIKSLGSKDVRTRLRAAMALGDIGPAARDAVPGLTKLLADADSDIRDEAVVALGAIGTDSQEVLHAIRPLLSVQDSRLRFHAHQALSHIGSASIPVLVDALKDPDWKTRLEAAGALEHIGPDAKSAVPALKACLTDPEREVRRWASLALSKIDPKPGAGKSEK